MPYNGAAMLTVEKTQEYYQALLQKNPEYEGVFYVALIWTSIKFWNARVKQNPFWRIFCPNIHIG